MYTNDIVEPLGQCKLGLKNASSNKIYGVEFVVVDGCTAILGNSAIQKIDLVRVQHKYIKNSKAEMGEDSQYTVVMSQRTKS